jgi:PadR family transcriptional regulator, regulatory protein PadR
MLSLSNFDIVLSLFDSGSKSKRYDSSVSHHQRELFFGLIRIHVLVHASHEPIFGLAMMEELARHGYRIGPGTLYPLLHGLERSGLLKSALQNVGGHSRRVYKITSGGRRALDKSKTKVDELHHELHEEHPRKISQST